MKKYHSDKDGWQNGHKTKTFQSESSALNYLAHYLINPNPDRSFVLRSECTYGVERHDALDYLMHTHGYRVVFI